MSTFPEYINFKFGIYVETFVEWLLDHYMGFFEGIGDGVLWFLLKTDSFLQWLPWWALVALVFFLGWKYKKLSAGILYAVLLTSIGVFGLWELTMSTLSIVLTAVIISLLIGLPVGIWMAYNARVELIIKPILDAMQTMPSFVYLIPAMMFFGLGMVPAVFATLVYALPPVIRLTDLGIQSVSKEMVEAAHSFGSSSWQTLFKVQLPQALPTIMTGINQTTMMALSMVVICSMIGVKGLGYEVLAGISRVEIARAFDAGLSIVILAIIIDRISQGVANKYKIPEQ
ncbi:MAG: proline/glycine betaine ABC transporter permease [Clostridia bacterium]|nr:proline/glycine betaine ABC transporter permease [Clostridia bacterium]MDD4047589.1 proline/glycine betaine ABC transporter permease [Clostridia bacterium]